MLKDSEIQTVQNIYNTNFLFVFTDSSKLHSCLHKRYCASFKLKIIIPWCHAQSFHALSEIISGSTPFSWDCIFTCHISCIPSTLLTHPYSYESNQAVKWNTEQLMCFSMLHIWRTGYVPCSAMICLHVMPHLHITL